MYKIKYIQGICMGEINKKGEDIQKNVMSKVK